MKKVARKYSGHPLVRELAVNILNHYGTDSHNHIDEARAIGDYVKNNVRYVKDPDKIEYLMEPTLMIKKMAMGEGRGDCDDMSCLVATLCLSVGIQPHYAIVKYKQNSPSFNHIYVVVYDRNYREKKKTRLVIDAIVKDKPIGYEVKHNEIKEIKV